MMVMAAGQVRKDFYHATTELSSPNHLCLPHLCLPHLSPSHLVGPGNMAQQSNA